MNIDLANAYKRQLEQELKVQLKLSQERFDLIYRRTCRNSPKHLPNSTCIFTKLEQKLKAFQRNPGKHLSSQIKYDCWFMTLTDHLKNEIKLPFGYAQKFVNILMKDWCVENVAKKKFNYKFLHAPIDNFVANAVCRYTNWKKPTNGKSLYVNLDRNNPDRNDYSRFQEELKLLGEKLEQKHLLNFIPTRLDIEQLIWGWI